MPIEEDWPTASVPEPFDRTVRFGPFPSARDAVKFVTYAAAGALLSPVAAPIVWLPVVVAGFVVSVWRPEGRALDERAFTMLRWGVRVVGRELAVRRDAVDITLRHRMVRWNGRYVAVLRAGGIPLAYLPPSELARRFDGYRDLVRAVGGSWVLLTGEAPLHLRSIRPGGGPLTEAERAARDGYTELLRLIAARRPLRRIHLLLSDADPGPEGVGRIEAAATRAVDRLGALGVRCERLTGRALSDAIRHLGPHSTLGAP